MAILCKPNEMLRALIDAAGIKEKRITSVTIKAAVGRHPCVIVEFYPEDLLLRSIGPVLKEYELHPVDPAESVPPI